MNRTEALAFVQKHGIVLVSGQGPVPRFTEAVAGAPIKGSWWGHPKGHHIFNSLQYVFDSENILVCRLVGGKVTLVHRRLWPALVRVANRFPKERIAWVQQEHTPSGHHENKEVPFPKWVPSEIKNQAKILSEEEALQALGPWVFISKEIVQKNSARKTKK